MYKTQIEDFQIRLDKIVEYEKNRPQNDISVKMWDKLLNPEGHLLGGFFKRWGSEGVLNGTFVQEMKPLVGDAFDQIAGLESHKIKESEVNFK